MRGMSLLSLKPCPGTPIERDPLTPVVEVGIAGFALQPLPRVVSS